VTDRRNPGLGLWLREGIALYLAEQTPSPGAVQSRRDITFDEFSVEGSLRFADVGGYTLAYTLIEFIDSTYGWQAVVDLVEPGATYESVLGLSCRQLYDRWQAGLAVL
jgi:hypothetical protein